MKKVMEIREKDIRTAITNMFHMIKNFEEIEHDKRNKINFKMTQIKLMEMKNTFCEKYTGYD